MAGNSETSAAKPGKLASTEIAQSREQAMKFVGLVLDSQSPEAGDIDGGTIEEWLIQCGFYKPTEVTEPCSLDEAGEWGGCSCAEVGFPAICNRWTDLAREAERIRGKV